VAGASSANCCESFTPAIGKIVMLPVERAHEIFDALKLNVLLPMSGLIFPGGAGLDSEATVPLNGESWPEVTVELL